MNPTIWAVVFLTLSFIPASAQQTDTQQKRTQQSKVAGPNDSPQHKVRPAIVAACQDLETFSASIDKLYDEAGNPVFDIVGTDGSHYGPPSADDPDSFGSKLTDCAIQTRSQSEWAKAVRALARWEFWRAQWFQKQYRAALPVKSPQCQDLGKFDSEVEAALPNAEALASYRLPDNLNQIETPLVNCAVDSKQLNRGKPIPEFARAYEDLSNLKSSSDLSEQNRISAEAAEPATKGEVAPRLTESSLRGSLADPSAFIVLGPGDRLASDALS